MSENQLSKEKEVQIEKIKEEWINEVKKITEYKPQSAFDQTVDIKLGELEKKYRECIRKIIDDNI